MTGPGQYRAEVRGVCPEGAYVRIGFHAPQVASTARPGQFVALAVGEETTATLLRRCFSIAQVSPERGDLSLLVSAVGAGSRWLARRSPGDVVDLIGPLGRPFPQPDPAAGCVLVGGGYGAAPLVWWGRELVAAGHPVAFVLGAATGQRVAEADAARQVGGLVFVTTDDGSLGVHGRVTDVLTDAMDSVRGDAAVEVYGCGPMAMLRACEDVAAAEGGVSWCATEESMACGVGVCMTCVLPVYERDGSVRMARTCVEGPTFAGSSIAWDAIGQVLPA